MLSVKSGLDKLKSNFNSNVIKEDEFNLNSGNYADTSLNLGGDTNFISKEGNLQPMEVEISCINKRKKVRALLADNVKITGQSEWEDMFGSGITGMAGSLLQTVDHIEQLTKGESIQQPWFNRKFWKTSKPLPISFSINFVTEENAKDDVYDPCVALLSFAYPRETNSKYTSEHIKGGAIGNTINAFHMYRIPGPTLNYNPNEPTGNEGGDPVSITIGNAFVFGGVFLEKVDLEFSKIFDTNGYPLAAKVSIQATAMDALTCDSNGRFLISEIPNATNDVATAINSWQTLMKDFQENTIKVYKSTIGFYKTKGDGSGKEL